ncbi:MAG: hypothetical protein HYV26_20150 [Candidatus Hydrogenedentes bacterium]|nr:hypothetical protein [Candidatus Hydrogenedentota bacterium]
MSTFSTTDFVLLGLYALLLVLLGASGYRRGDSPRGYFLGGRRAGWFTVGVSMVVSLASSLGFVAVPAAAHQSGVIMLWSLLALPLVYPLITRVFIPFYQRLDVLTAYEYLERRFDRRVRCFASGLFIAWRLTWMAAILYVPAMALDVVSGGALRIPVSVLALAAIATTYTLLGGMRGIFWADAAQGVLMYGSILAVIAAITHSQPGGLDALWTLAADRLQPFAAAPGWADATWIERLHYYLYTDFTALAIIVSFTVGKLGNYGADQLMIQRYLSARSESAARRGFLFNCVLFAVFFTLMTAAGLALAVFSAQASFPTGLKADAVFPHYVAHHAPRGLAGLMMAGLIAAALSSFDSGIHACATALATDFGMRNAEAGRTVGGEFRGENTKPRTGSSQTTLGVRLMTLAFGVLAAVLGCFIGHMGDVFEIALRLVNSFIGPLLALFLLALFTRHATARGVLLGSSLGAAFTALLVLAGPLSVAGVSSPVPSLRLLLNALDIGFLWVAPAGLLFSLAAGYTASLFFTPDPGAQCWTLRALLPGSGGVPHPPRGDSRATLSGVWQPPSSHV